MQVIKLSVVVSTILFTNVFGYESINIEKKVNESEPIEIVYSKPKSYNESEFYSNSQMKEKEFTVQETRPGFTNPNINGVMGDRVNLTIDGNRFYNSTFRSGPNQYYSWIPSQFTTDISLGKSDAQLGYITIDKTLGVGGTLIEADYTSYNRGTSVFGAYTDDKVSFGVLNIKDNNLHTTKGEINHTGYNQTGLFGEYKHSGNSITKVLFTDSKDLDRTDKFEQNKPLIYKDQRFINVSNKTSFGDILVSTFMSNSYEDIDDINTGALNKRKTSEIEDTMLGIDIKYYVGEGIIGVSEAHEWVKYQNDTIATNPKKYVNFTTDTASLYGYYELPRVSKYEHSMKVDATVQQFNGPTMTKENNQYKSFNGSYVGKWDSLSVSVSRSTRVPTLANLAFDMTGVNGTGIPNPSLKAEQYNEIKMTYTPYKGVKIYTYKSLVKDYIASNGIMAINTDAVLAGYGMQVSRVYGDLKFDGNIQRQYGSTNLDQVDKLVPLFGNAKVEYKGFMIEELFSAKDDSQSAGDKTDTRIIGHNVGYNITNIGYTHKVSKNDTINVKGYNIFNKEGRVYGSSVDFYGRSFGLTYKHTF